MTHRFIWCFSQSGFTKPTVAETKQVFSHKFHCLTDGSPPQVKKEKRHQGTNGIISGNNNVLGVSKKKIWRPIPC
jgi:hypothetical protein